MKTLKITAITTALIIGYHIGNVKEMTGLFSYAHSKHLKIVKIESVNDMVLVTLKTK